MAADFLHTTVTDRFETAVEFLQTVLATLLVALFALGVLDIVLLIAIPFASGNITDEGRSST